MLEYRVLGPLEVLRDGRPVVLGKGAERALLAFLVLHAGRALSTDELVEALWAERPPPTAREMVRNYVGSARRRLGSDAIETTQHGYVLTAAGEAVDVQLFKQLLHEGRSAGNVDTAAAKLEEALVLWRGRPLPELDDVATAAGDVRQLEELHATSLEDWFDTQLELGRAATVVTALEVFVDEHPYRERPLRQLMLALYRSGRQKDALDRFAATRRKLVDDTGLEPGSELRELQRRILRQDPSLDFPVEQLQAPASRPNRRWRRSLGAAGLLAATGGAVAAVLLLWPTARPVAVPSRGVVELDQRTGQLLAATPVAFTPGPIAVSGGRLWIGATSARSIAELQPRRRTVSLPRVPFALATIGDDVWVANGLDGTLIRIDRSGRARRPIRPEPGSVGRLPLSAGNGVLWVGSQDGTVTELSPAGRTIAVVHGIGLPETVAVSGGAVWIGRATEDAVVRVDARSHRIRAVIRIGGRPDIVATGDEVVWAMTADAATLWRIDPRMDAVTASVTLPATPTALAVTQDGVWVGSASGILSKIDPETNTVSRTRLLGRPIDALTADEGRLWASVG